MRAHSCESSVCVNKNLDESGQTLVASALNTRAESMWARGRERERAHLD